MPKWQHSEKAAKTKERGCLESPKESRILLCFVFFQNVGQRMLKEEILEEQQDQIDALKKQAVSLTKELEEKKDQHFAIRDCLFKYQGDTKQRLKLRKTPETKEILFVSGSNLLFWNDPGKESAKCSLVLLISLSLSLFLRARVGALGRWGGGKGGKAKLATKKMKHSGSDRNRNDGYDHFKWSYLYKWLVFSYGAG